VVVDISMPPAVEPGDVAGVTRITLQTIEQKVDAERQRRLAEVPRVEAVMARELDRLHVWARRHALRPLMSDLRKKIEAIRQAELARTALERPASPADRAVLDRLSRRLLEQVLAGPLAKLESGATPIDPAQAQYLRQLFALGLEVTSCP
jgi:glutamyl-tRNA reductase